MASTLSALPVRKNSRTTPPAGTGGRAFPELLVVGGLVWLRVSFRLRSDLVYQLRECVELRGELSHRYLTGGIIRYL